MVLRTIVSALCVCTFSAMGCVGEPDGPPASEPCYLNPNLPECSCDDEDPCTIDTREADDCKHGAVTYGDACIGQAGFCDVGGVCRTECDNMPCFDWTVEHGVGCAYTEHPNGWQCTASGGDGGLCDEGECFVPHTDAEACKWRDEYEPCSFDGTNGVCRGGICAPRSETDATCTQQETKCTTDSIAAGWCGTWEWPIDPTPELYCRSCIEIECAGVPGCSVVGDTCQGSDGTGGCPPGCCPICY